MATRFPRIWANCRKLLSFYWRGSLVQYIF